MLGNIQTLLSGRNWLCLILKPHNKGYISFVSILNLSINSGYFTFFLPFFSVPLPSLCPCLPHPLPSGSLPPSLPTLPLSLPVSFLHSLTTYHSSRHCLPSLTPSIPPCLFSSVPPCISLSSTLLPFLYAFHPSLPSSITPLPGPLSPS